VKHENILIQKPQIALKSFLLRCKKIDGIDIDLVRNIAIITIRYLRGNKELRDQMRPLQLLEQRWYESLINKNPEWKIYDTDLYLAELWACWVVYSRNYLLAIQSPKSLLTNSIVSDLGKVQRIIDLGNGFGYTTASLKKIFPTAEVIGTNLENTKQIELARQIGQEYGYEVISNINEIENPVDLIFASEYFEHIPAPISHLRDILYRFKPKALLIANSFGTKAIGHFNYYNVNGSNLNGKATSRQFNLELRKWGFEKIKTQLWNNRPSYWK
jgi:SAM-dependent methyltransferase